MKTAPKSGRNLWSELPTTWTIEKGGDFGAMPFLGDWYRRRGRKSSVGRDFASFVQQKFQGEFGATLSQQRRKIVANLSFLAITMFMTVIGVAFGFGRTAGCTAIALFFYFLGALLMTSNSENAHVAAGFFVLGSIALLFAGVLLFVVRVW